MEKQGELFSEDIGRGFKRDQWSKEDLEFQIHSLEKEILALKMSNARLRSQINTQVQNQLENEDKDTGEFSYSNLQLPLVKATEEGKSSWGARYQSQNPEVSNIEIPNEAQPDHIYSDDRLDYLLEESCGCSNCEPNQRENLHALDDLVTRKLILSRERRMSFRCQSCGERGIHKLIEKHLEAELYCSNS